LIGPGLNLSSALSNDLVRLVTLAHANSESRPDIAIGFDGDVEVVRVVAGVRIVTSQIEIDTTATQARAGQTPVDRFFTRNDSDTHRPALPERVAGDERLEGVHRLEKVILKLFAASFESCRQVHHQTADPESSSASCDRPKPLRSDS
jgi:hypothetical protein